MTKSIYELLLSMNEILSTDLPKILLGKLDDICYAAMFILFLCLLLRFVIDCFNEGYNVGILKKYFLQMAILGAILSPLVFKQLAGIYINLFDLMMEHIANKEIKSLRESMLGFFQNMFDDGEAGTKKLFGIFEFNTTPLNLVLPMLVFALFIISVYQILTLPIIFACFTIAIAPILLALSPFLTDMKQKLAEMLFGTAIIFPLVLFGLGTFLPVSISAVSELLLDENMILLTIICLCYSFVIAYSLPVIGFISGLSFISDLRVMFPITWFEYLIAKPIGFVLAYSNKGKKGK